MRAAEDQRAAGRRDKFFQPLEVHRVSSVFIFKRVFGDDAPSFADRPVERHINGRLDYYLVAGLSESHHREGESGDDARSPAHRLAAEFPAVVFPLPGADRVAQRVGDHRVAKRALVDLLMDRLQHLGRRGEIHIGDPHRQQIAAAEIILESVPFFAVGTSSVHVFIEIVFHRSLPLLWPYAVFSFIFSALLSVYASPN
ncbi:hypothetical protein SDC9_145296 [bioreactor metagenome]|uniref:Uncharacterized protein n=1 Tax=bioreactor metagenome TaxID=1076179 RepID=A0A645E9G5_9ZZZZ